MVARISWLAIAVTLAVFAVACDTGGEPVTSGAPGGPTLSGKPTGGRDIILVTIDTLRFDAVGYAGAHPVSTPSIDRVAQSGLVFETAHAHAVVTLPSHASILTGLYPHQHGIRENAGFVLDEGVVTLASLLQDAGYRTAAFVSAFTVDRRFGLDRGFDVYDDRYEGHGAMRFTPAERPGSDTVALALDWWEQDDDRPRFVWVHVFTPHFPYEPREPFASRHPDNPYFGDVEMADAEIAPLLDRVLDGPDRDALLIVTSDHGESLGEHGEATHGTFAYESTLRVPLVVRCGDLVPSGSTVRHARHVDLVPTVLHLVGLDTPEGLPGRSLFGPTPGGSDAGSYFEAMSTHLNRGWAPLRGRIEGRHKAIELPIPELYDLREDPRELQNRAEQDRERLRAIFRGLPEFRDPAGGRSELDDEVVERLRSLGYAAGTADRSDRRDDPALDPKNLIHLDRELDAAIAAYHSGDVEGAIGAMKGVIERQPGLSLAYAHLAYFLQDTGRTAEAVDVLRTAMSAGAGNESVRRKLALGLIGLGRPDEARDVLRGLEESHDPETQAAIGRAEAVLGNASAARRRFERSLEIDPSFPVAHMDLGVLLLGEERLDEAGVALQRAVDADPFLAEAWNALGVLHMRRGEEDTALAAWRRATDADPRMADALFNLGLVLGRRGERTKAIEALTRYAQLATGEDRERALAMIRTLEGRPSS